MTATVQIRRPAATPSFLGDAVSKAIQSLRTSGEAYVRQAYDRPWLRDSEPRRDARRG
ncbi:hypothetical protein [Caulobacter mirabilis]|uniref:hypothetical protein n=1 Tax=Caulobacter mirabilis TaxID=69666 RepID=UPI001558B2B6|nr:hypothetical protein [Caulobacter mirabilis]